MIQKHATNGSRAGFGLVEVVIAGTILFLLAASMVEAVSQVGAIGRSSSTIARLQDGAQDALSTITADLKDSGFVTVDGLEYPHLFEDGAPGAGFEAHAHGGAIENAQADEPDFGVNREIVFVRPRFQEVAQDTDGVNHELVDEDGDALAIPGGVTIAKRYSFPVIGADGVVAYDETEHSFVVVPGNDGVNELQRRADAGAARVIARGVERLVFDTSATAPVDVPVGAVRVRLWMRLADEEGTVHRHFAQTVVRLQNGG
jgi:hypothetical protein